jgi:hypothetical protein
VGGWVGGWVGGGGEHNSIGQSLIAEGDENSKK